MRGPENLAVLALSDDLSGAAETAAALMSRAAEVRVSLDPSPESAHNAQGAPTLVVDLDTRNGCPADTTDAVRRAVGTHARNAVRILTKVDSLLRGNVHATVMALRGGTGGAEHPVILAPACPAAGRTVVDGVVHVDGTPLHETSAWAAEPSAPPRSITQVITSCELLPLSVVRSGHLSAALAESCRNGRIPVCDAETDSDLDRVVASAAPDARLVGSGGLASALGRTLRGSGPPPATPVPGRDRALLVVVGSAAKVVTTQVRRLCDAGAALVPIDPHNDVRQKDIDRAVAALSERPTVLGLNARGVDSATSRAVVRRLAVAAIRVVESVGGADLVLTGGETARRVLDALGVRSLRPLCEVHDAAVHSLTPDHTSVVTRPGSFGAPDSLLRIVRHLRPDFPLQTQPGLVPGTTEGQA